MNEILTGVPSSVVVYGIDLAILVLVVEAVILRIYRVRTGRGLPTTTILLIALSGIGLLLAVRAAVHGQGLAAVGLFLILGGIFHAIDLTRRITDANRRG